MGIIEMHYEYDLCKKDDKEFQSCFILKTIK